MELIYENNSSPIGIVQIIHGMEEHSGRYRNFAKFLNSHRYIVILSDLKAHGKEAFKHNSLGVFKEKFDVFVSQQIDITKEITKNYPQLPITILGHSMGSFIAQQHMKEVSSNFENISYIFMGSSYSRRGLIKIGRTIFLKMADLIPNPKKHFNEIILSGVSSNFKNEENTSWLTRDNEAVKKFLADPLCGFTYVTEFYSNFLDFLIKLFMPKKFNNVNRNIDILIVSGEADPVGIFGFGVKKLYEFYENLEFKNLSLKLYPECRHEILNELNKKEVYNDIYVWLKSKKIK